MDFKVHNNFVIIWIELNEIEFELKVITSYES